MPLSKDEERQLIQRMLEGDLQARNELVMEYKEEGRIKAVAIEVCKKRGCWDSFDDLVQEGSIELIKCLNRFKPDKGAKPWTYAYRRVWGAMHDYINKVRGIDRLASKVWKAHEKLMKELEQKPTPEEIAKAVGASKKKVEEVLNFSVESLEELMEPTERGEGTWEPTGKHRLRGDDVDQLQEVMTREEKEVIRFAISFLPTEQSEILRLYHWEELTVEEISKSLDKPLGTVKVYKRRGEEKLKQFVAVLYKYDGDSDEEVGNITGLPEKQVRELRKAYRDLKNNGGDYDV